MAVDLGFKRLVVSLFSFRVVFMYFFLGLNVKIISGLIICKGVFV